VRKKEKEKERERERESARERERERESEREILQVKTIFVYVKDSFCSNVCSFLYLILFLRYPSLNPVYDYLEYVIILRFPECMPSQRGIIITNHWTLRDLRKEFFADSIRVFEVISTSVSHRAMEKSDILA